MKLLENHEYQAEEFLFEINGTEYWVLVQYCDEPIIVRVYDTAEQQTYHNFDVSPIDDGWMIDGDVVEFINQHNA